MSRIQFELRMLLAGLIIYGTTILILLIFNLNTAARRNASMEKSTASGGFRRRPETKHIRCDFLFRNDKDYVNHTRHHRAKLVRDDNLNMSCDAVNNRVLPQISLKSLEFGIAFARNIFQDYELIEDFVRANWHPQNYFCFALDVKSSPTLKKRIGILASCISNVFVSLDQFNMTSSGHYTNHAHLSCLNILVAQKGWKYVLLLQNHDIVIKTSYELIEIYNLLNGANDMQIMPNTPGDRVNKSLSWTPEELNLFLNNSKKTFPYGNNIIKVGKGAVHLSLVKEAVEWMIYSVNLTQIMARFNSLRHGADEELFQTLHINEFLEMPGGFTTTCLNQSKYVDYASRFDVYGGFSNLPCKTKYTRHSTCILGIEDLSKLSKLPHLSANKVLPDFDYGVVDCIHELLFNRTFLNQSNEININYYSKLPHVIYNRLKKLNKSNIMASEVCTDTQSLWKFLE